MADFKQALNQLLGDEGGYVHVQGDSGGETYAGISRKNFSQWPGWSIVDRAKASSKSFASDDYKSFSAGLAALSELTVALESFYRDNFWKFDGIKDQVVAEKVFNEAVNMGLASVVKILQAGLIEIGAVHRCVTPDGIYGEGTEAAVNSANPDDVLHQLRGRIAYRYHRIIVAAPSQEKFAHAWFMRAAE